MPPSTTPARSSTIKTKTKTQSQSLALRDTHTHTTPNAPTSANETTPSPTARARNLPPDARGRSKSYPPTVSSPTHRARAFANASNGDDASDPRSSIRSIDFDVRYAPFRKPRAVHARRPASRSRVGASRMKRKVFFTRRRSLARVATSRARVGTHARDARARARGSCVGVRRVWVNSNLISHQGSFVIHRYFFGFGFERESVVLPMEFSSSIGTRRAVRAVLGDTSHRAPSRASSSSSSSSWSRDRDRDSD